MLVNVLEIPMLQIIDVDCFAEHMQ